MRLELSYQTIRHLAWSATEGSTESLLPGNLTHRLLDAVVSFFQKLKIKLSELTTQFGTTEYQEFARSNAKRLDILIRSPAQSIQKILLPIPPGMVHTYRDTTAQLLSLIKLHSNINTLTLLESAVRAAQVLIERDDPSSHKALERFYLTGRTTIQSSIDAIDKDLRVQFDTKKPLLQKPSQELYPTKQILSDTLREFDSIQSVYDACLKKRAAIQSEFDKCDKIVSAIIDNPEHFTKDDLVYLSAGMMNVARMVELQGITLNLLQQVEHLGTMGLKMLLGLPIKK